MNAAEIEIIIGAQRVRVRDLPAAKLEALAECFVAAAKTKRAAAARREREVVFAWPFVHSTVGEL